MKNGLQNLSIRLAFTVSVFMPIVCSAQSDTAYKLSPRQLDSLIRFSESVKTLRERFDVSIREAATFKSLWQSEKDARIKDKEDYKVILEGYAAIETSNRIEITGLKKQVRKATIGKRLWQVIAGIAAGFAVYLAVR